MVNTFNDLLDRQIIFNQAVLFIKERVVLIIICGWKILSVQWLVRVSAPEHHQIFNILLWGAISSCFFFFFAFQTMKGFYEDLAVTVLGSNLVWGSIEDRDGGKYEK